MVGYLIFRKIWFSLWWVSVNFRLRIHTLHCSHNMLLDTSDTCENGKVFMIFITQLWFLVQHFIVSIVSKLWKAFSSKWQIFLCTHSFKIQILCAVLAVLQFLQCFFLDLLVSKHKIERKRQYSSLFKRDTNRIYYIEEYTSTGLLLPSKASHSLFQRKAENVILDNSNRKRK